QIGTSGSNVTFGGTIIGTFTGGTASNLVISLNANATATAVQALVRQIGYYSTSANPDVNGTVPNRFATVTVNDGGNSGQGGALAASQSGVLNVTTVYAAPVLADTALTFTINEDPGVPSGAVGTLVSAFTGGESSSVSTKGIAITGSVETNGTWYYSINGGATWLPVGIVSSSSSLL